VLRVAWLNEGLVGTEPWTDAHHRASRAVEASLAGDVEATFVEQVSPRRAAGAIDELVGSGHRLIFATSAAFEASLVAASLRHARVAFANARATTVRSNLGTFGGSDAGPLYLAGIAAGEQARPDDARIGFVGARREAETLRNIEAFARGVRMVRPDASISVRWMGRWWDPDVEMSHAHELATQGVDVLVSGGIGSAVGEVAQQHGLGWVGHGSDRSREFPDVWLTAAVPDWTVYYRGEVESMLQGCWRARAYRGSIADGFTDLAPFGRRVAPPVRARIAALRARMIDGTFEVPDSSSGGGLD